MIGNIYKSKFQQGPFQSYNEIIFILFTMTITKIPKGTIICMQRAAPQTKCCEEINCLNVKPHNIAVSITHFFFRGSGKKYNALRTLCCTKKGIIHLEIMEGLLQKKKKQELEVPLGYEHKDFSGASYVTPHMNASITHKYIFCPQIY